MSELEKKALKPSFVLVTAFFLFSELWDLLIYYLFPNRPRVTTFLAAAITSPTSPFDIFINIIFEGMFILLFSFGLSWLLRKLAFPKEFFERQKLSTWFLVGVILSLIEFQELFGDIWANLLFFALLIGFGYRYKKYRESRIANKNSPNS